MIKKIILVLNISLLAFINNYAQVGRLALSPLQTVNQKLAKTDIELNYSRPAMRERQIFGGLVPFNKIWRTGANRSTKITFSEDVYVDTTRLKKGTYALYTKPQMDQWDIYFYTELDNWGVPEDWDEKKIAAQINVKPETSSWKRESFTLSIDDMNNEAFMLSIMWDELIVKVPIQLTTEELMNATIEDVLNGPEASDYYLSSQYQFESGRHLEKSLNWINKCIEIRENEVWWDLSLKCKIMIALDKSNSEIKPYAQKGLELAKERESAYGIKELTGILTDLE